jgi:hypothetical protein
MRAPSRTSPADAKMSWHPILPDIHCLPVDIIELAKGLTLIVAAHVVVIYVHRPKELHLPFS